ncbi:hypothetical protein [Mycoplasmopsis alligatoris]|uniref:Uncharacterized protein n=1 Tax=Mycoplasmopsis alligatoris A21JP2 TaxID=747682 RepID=D4XVY9_9BACT|nr:hypothetical protein [Mycoplasmopsis alligatoris]EFF41487.1 hypothetical protein MALL_0012 [Mycoplasmopsis alligatoris A21JP2]
MYEINVDKKLVDTYTIDINKIEDQINVEKYKEYLYQEVYGKQKNKNTIYLDSKREKAFMEQIVKDYSKDSILVEWTKLPTIGSEIYFEYFNTKKGKLTKSYPDFLLKAKQKDGKVKSIYVEVKAADDQDMDPDKTNDIKHAYKKYSSKLPDSLLLEVCYVTVKSNNEYIKELIKNKAGQVISITNNSKDNSKKWIDVIID